MSVRSSASIGASGLAVATEASATERSAVSAPLAAAAAEWAGSEAHAAPRGSTTATCVMAAAAALLGAAGGAAPDALDPAAADSDAAPKKPNENVLRWHGGRATSSETSINLIFKF
jgi:hypothetical protein